MLEKEKNIKIFIKITICFFHLCMKWSMRTIFLCFKKFRSSTRSYEEIVLFSLKVSHSVLQIELMNRKRKNYNNSFLI